MSDSISAHIHPGAKVNNIVTKTGANFDIWVTAQPENNKANIACIKLLAKHLHIAPSQLKIVRGRASRRKIISLS